MSYAQLLHATCAEFFGKEVSVSSRAQASLLETARLVELFGSQVAVTSPLEVFAELVGCSPACCDIFARERIPIHLLPKSTPGAIGMAKLHIQDHSEPHVFSSLRFALNGQNRR